MTPAERQTLADAQGALLEAITAAARAVVSLSTAMRADDGPKPGPPKERS